MTAALARGASRLTGALVADDTAAMRGALSGLGIAVDDDPDAGQLRVEGCGGRLSAISARVDARSAGTVARFVAPMLMLGEGDYVLDGSAQLRARPMAGTLRAMRELGSAPECLQADGYLPIRVRGVAGRAGARVEVSGAASSQFLSGLLLTAPCLADGLTIDLADTLVSRPYVAMTVEIMRAFGATVEADGDARFVAAPTGYAARDYAIEPDASAASYFFAAAAITGGQVTVRGLGAASLQGDLAFVRVLERMGCEVRIGPEATELVAPPRLHGVDVDMADISDTAQTLAAVAPFAATPTRIRGIGFIRNKESDRIGAVVRELRRAGVTADEDEDGMVIEPSTPHACRIETYDDHRMAMSFALIGLRTPGLVIADPACVAKTYPGYFGDLRDFTGLECRSQPGDPDPG